MAAQPKVPVLSGSRSHQVSQISQYIDAKLKADGNSDVAAENPNGAVTYGQEFTIYADENPNLSAKQAYVGWLLTSVGGALPATFDDIFGATGKAVKPIVEGTVAGLEQTGQDIAGVTDFFGRLTEGNLWLRVGEVLLGIVLIGVGLARITGTQNIVSSAVKARIP
jgi:hypothetical protein